MKKIITPKRNDWALLTQRPNLKVEDLSALVQEVFLDIQQRGDQALREYTQKFDKVNLDNFKVETQEVEDAKNQLSDDLKNAIQVAKNNIEKFHLSQKEEKQIIETTKGVYCWRESRAIEKVGLYIPGGTAPLFSTLLMLGIPANIAGCRDIILCTPPNKEGKVHPAILYTASLLNIQNIYKVGGIQAIGAMTFGTESIGKIDKVFGPGNQYVTAAKQAAQRYGVAIDMPAGPSEVLVIADEFCKPAFVAADLLSQAEHGDDSQVILLSDKDEVVEAVLKEIAQQLKNLPRKEIAQKALENSKAIVLENLNECIEFSNLYAPEHLILALKNARSFISQITNAGSVFLGNYSCESAGDYASGTNHTLPTNGYARNYSGVSLDSFIKKITFQELTQEGLQNIGPSIEQMAEAEELIAHKNAVSIRLQSLV